MVGRTGIHKIKNNTLGKNSEDVFRNYFIERNYPIGSTFLTVEKLKKIEYDFEMDGCVQRTFIDIDLDEEC